MSFGRSRQRAGPDEWRRQESSKKQTGPRHGADRAGLHTGRILSGISQEKARRNAQEFSQFVRFHENKWVYL